MLFDYAKKIYEKGFVFAMRAMPIIVGVLLILHVNSTASCVNGQEELPDSVKKYRKF